MSDELKKIVIRVKSPEGDTVREEWDRALKRGEIARYVGWLKRYGGHDADIVLPEKPLEHRAIFFYGTEAVKQKIIAKFPSAMLEDGAMPAANPPVKKVG